MEMMLPPKPNRFRRWSRVLLFSVVYAVQSLFKVFGFEDITREPIFLVIFNLLSALTAILLVMLLYRDTVWKRLLAFVCSYLALGTSEMAFFLLPTAYIQTGLSLDFSQPDMMLGSFLAMIVSSIALALVTLLWRRFQNKRTPRFTFTGCIILRKSLL